MSPLHGKVYQPKRAHGSVADAGKPQSLVVPVYASRLAFTAVAKTSLADNWGVSHHSLQQAASSSSASSSSAELLSLKPFSLEPFSLQSLSDVG